jgi:hypothetical protein
MPRFPDLPRPSVPRVGRAHLRLVVPADDGPPPTADPFVENAPMPTVNLSTDTPMTFTFRGLTVPTVEALCAELFTRRAAGEHTNPQIFAFDPTEMHYGPPRILVTGTVPVDNRGEIVNAEESVIIQTPWDHTVWSLLEAAEIAKHYEGAVYITQDIRVPSFGGDEDEVEDDGTTWVDEGFEVMVADHRPPYVQDEKLTSAQRAAAYLAAHPDAAGDEDDDEGEE